MSPMELARDVRRRKIEIGNRQGERGDVKSKRRGKTAQIIGEELGMSSAKVEMYDRLNDLINDLAVLVDTGRIKPTVARHFASVSPEQQRLLAAQIAGEPSIEATISEQLSKQMVDAIKKSDAREPWAFVPLKQYQQMERTIERLEKQLDVAGNRFEIAKLTAEKENLDRLQKESYIYRQMVARYSSLLEKYERAGMIGPEWRTYERAAHEDWAKYYERMNRGKPYQPAQTFNRK